MENQNQKKPAFLNTYSGTAQNFGASLFHADGFISNKIQQKYRPADGDKKATFSFGLSVNTNVFETLGRAEGDPEKYKNSQESRVFFCAIRGDEAEKYKDQELHGKYTITGRIYRATYKDKTSGEEKELVACQVFSLVPVTTLSAAPKFIPGMQIQNAKGESQTMLCAVAGKVTWLDDEVRTTRTGESFRFSIRPEGNVAKAYAAATGTKASDGEAPTLSVTVWRNAQRVKEQLHKGQPVILTGVVSTNVVNDKTYYNMSLRCMTYYPKSQTPDDHNSEANQPKNENADTNAAADNAPQYAGVGDLAAIAEAEDDELPF